MVMIAIVDDGVVLEGGRVSRDAGQVPLGFINDHAPAVIQIIIHIKGLAAIGTLQGAVLSECTTQRLLLEHRDRNREGKVRVLFEMAEEGIGERSGRSLYLLLSTSGTLSDQTNPSTTTLEGLKIALSCPRLVA